MLRRYLSVLIFLVSLLLANRSDALVRSTILSAVDPVATEAYSTTVTEVEKFGSVIIQSDVSTLNSTTIVVTVYGRVRDSALWVTLGTLTHSSTGSLMLNIVERVYAIRVGHKATGNSAGDSLTVYIEGK